MKLKNKKTGEVADFRYLLSDYVAPLVLTTYENDKPKMYRYNSLAELNEEWEDYEEPKEYWFINSLGKVEKAPLDWLCNEKDCRQEIGNRFSSEEEAELAVCKLKAWKRLKDEGFRFDNFIRDAIYYEISDEENKKDNVQKDLDLLFGGENE